MITFEQYTVHGTAGAGELATMLTLYSPLSTGGTRTVTAACVALWQRARELTGMPRPTPTREPQGEPRWDRAAVLLWFLSWAGPRAYTGRQVPLCRPRRATPC